MSNFLVTGGAGFIGSNLVDNLLCAGHEVTVIDNLDDFYNSEIKLENIRVALCNPRCRLYKADIRDENEMISIFTENSFDTVIHLAAKAGVRPSIENPNIYYDVNVSGTLNILEAMRRTNVKRLLFASSSSVYGNNKKIPFCETDVVDYPISPYAASKKAGELLCHTYHHLYNFDIFCFRFFTVYGPRQRPDLAINKFVKLILSDSPIKIFGEGTTLRDYTYIDDIVSGIVNGIKYLKGFEIINLGESQPVQLMELISTLEKVIGKTAIKEYLPMQAGDVNTTYANIEKAKQLIQYNPRTKILDGIEKYIRWLTKK